MRAFRLILAVALTAAAAGCDWPQFRGGPDHTGHNQFESAIGLDTLDELEEAFTGPPDSAGSVTVASDAAYSVGDRIVAFDAEEGDLSWSSAPAELTTPQAVGSGSIFVGAYPYALHAYDANGVDNCTGTPSVCEPLWTAFSGDDTRTPVVADGVVYVAGAGRLRAYDAQGIDGCSGSPTTCAPLWTGSTTGIVVAGPSVRGGVVYVAAAGGGLFAFDAAGEANCSGVPKTCDPLWTASAGVYIAAGGPAVANRSVYFTTFTGDVVAFDARGITNCAGTPKVCTPLWTANVGAQISSAPAVTGSTVYANGQNHELYAFDARGETGCSGIPRTCTPLWSARIAPDDFPNCTGRCVVGLSPIVSNGVVFTGSADGNVYAFDAAGGVGCGGVPRTCDPLWTTPGTGDPIVANGRLYVSKVDGRVHVYEVSPAGS